MSFFNNLNRRVLVASSSSCPSAISASRTTVRFYPALQTYKTRIETVENVEKITSSMKMVATSKLRQAQRRLEPAMAWFQSVDRAFEHLAPPDQSGESAAAGGAQAAEATSDAAAVDDGSKKHLILLLNTDRGLCGAITSNVIRHSEVLRKKVAERGNEVEFASIGSKGQDALVSAKRNRQLGIVALEMGAKPPTFTEVSYLSEKLLERNVGSITIIYTKFINLLKNEVAVRHFHTVHQLSAQPQWQTTEFDDQDIFDSLSEFHFASAIWGYLHENQTCEQAVRMTAMDGASTNAAELVKELTLFYNKARQQAITTELSEIVGGMAAIMEE